MRRQKKKEKAMGPITFIQMDWSESESESEEWYWVPKGSFSCGRVMSVESES